MKTSWMTHLRTGLKLTTLSFLFTATSALALQSGDYTYVVNAGDDTVTVTTYTGAGGSVVIPDTLDDKPVTRIGAYSFKGCPNLTRVVIGNSVTSIGVEAFNACPLLTQAVIGSGVTSLEDNALSWCALLTQVDFKGTPPALGSCPFISSPVIIYYLPSKASSWSPTFGGYQTAPWYIAVTFDPEGGAVGPGLINVTNGGAYGSLPMPARTGYSFAGWWTGDNGTGTQVASATPVTEVANHTLYAAWVRDADVQYMVIDLSGGTNAASYPVTYLDSVPVGGWTDEFKTDKLVLRKIPAGSFTMGSPLDELGRETDVALRDETQHVVTLTKEFYIGVFEVTQYQWEHVMGNNPSADILASTNAVRPVENVAYDDIRGSSAGADWPRSGAVDATSFMGKVRMKAGLSTFDLPTEAQWEYACRAGTITALNSGKDLTGLVSCTNLAEVGRYYENGFAWSEGVTAKVGSYLPNAWGLYDMHGNVYESCLDWFGVYPGSETDPKGATSGSRRIGRGGSWGERPGRCRSAFRGHLFPSQTMNNVGFRTVWNLPTYRLTVNGGTGAGDFGAGEAVAVSTDGPAVGQVFAGWTVSPEGTDLGTNFFANLPSTTITMPGHDVILTAVFEASSYTVTFDPEGGEVSPSSATVTNGAAYGTLPLPTRAGFAFSGWWTGDNGTGSRVTEATWVTEVADHTLYAGWTLKVEGLYLVIDLSGGTNAANYPVSYLDSVPVGGWTDDFRTDKLVMRKIQSGSFTMGSPLDELGRENDVELRDETQHDVTLTKDYYIGVFEVTQRQWELVMGNNPSGDIKDTNNTVRPVEHVSYDDIRGSSAGAGWPLSRAVDATSFMGKVRMKAGLSTFDLPTEAQWEYACRAGTATALNSGKDLTGLSSCPNLAEVGRYYYNGGNGAVGVTAKVGSYLPNAWGLYDMHGNVYESCLDWFGVYPGSDTDPKGAESGSRRIERGGCWDSRTGYCRSAFRGHDYPSSPSDYVGFRAVWNLPAYRLTVNGGTGMGDFGAGETVAVAADVPAADKVFASWTVLPEGTDLGTNFFANLPSTTVTMPSNDVTLTSVFLNRYPLAYAAGVYGSVTGAVSQTVTQGDSGAPVVAVPNAGYRFVRWSDGRTDNPRTDAGVEAAVSVTALFGGMEFAAASFPCSEADGTVAVIVNGGLPDVACSVNLYVLPGSATASADYVALAKPAALLWAAGEIGPKTVMLQIRQDRLVEGPERFYVVLGQPAGGALGEPRIGAAVIADDDAGTLPNKGVFVAGVPQPQEGGRVTGGGYCLPGRTVRVSATPSRGWTLLHWENGSQAPARLVSGAEAAAGAFEGVKLCKAFFGLTSSIALPAVADPGAQQAMVGVRFEKALDITSESMPQVTVTGLPSGLKYDAATRTVSGVPTTPSVAGKPALVKVSVTNANNRSAPVTVSFTITVAPLPTWAVGVFNGYLRDGQKFGMGTATMTVTARGRISGKISAAGTNYSFSADAYLAGSSAGEFTFRTKVTATNAKRVVPLNVFVRQELVNEGPASLGVALERVDDPATQSPSLMLFRDVSGDADMRTTVTNLNGYYTATVQGEPGEGGAATDIFGSGYLSFTVANGKVKSVGKLADGTSVSLSSSLIICDEHTLFTVLYTSPVAYQGGSFYGFVVFDRDSGPKTCVTSFEAITWENRSSNGFSRELDLTGGWYDTVGNLYDYYRNNLLSVGTEPLAPVPVLSVGTNRFESVWWNPNDLPLSVKLNTSGVMSGITAPVAGAPVALPGGGWNYTVNGNTEALTITLARATGLFNGTFKAWFDYGSQHIAKSIRFEGIMTPVRLPSPEGIEGRGFFLWSEKVNARAQSYDFLIRSQEIEP